MMQMSQLQISQGRDVLSRLAGYLAFSTEGTDDVNKSVEEMVSDRVAALYAKSDEELAELGLTRDQIGPFVVRRFIDA